MDLCTEKRFIRINISKAGDEGLIHQQRFELPPVFMEHLKQKLRREIRTQRLWPQIAKNPLRILDKPHPAEFPDRAENKPPIPHQVQDHLIIFLFWQWEFIRRQSGFHPHITAHPKMTDEVSVIEGKMQKFPPAADIQNGSSQQTVLESDRVRFLDDPIPKDPDIVNGVSWNRWMVVGTALQPADNGFNFGEFGHLNNSFLLSGCGVGYSMLIQKFSAINPWKALAALQASRFYNQGDLAAQGGADHGFFAGILNQKPHGLVIRCS